MTTCLPVMLLVTDVLFSDQIVNLTTVKYKNNLSTAAAKPLVHPPEALALAHDVVSQVGVNVCSSLIALSSHQVTQLLLVVIRKVALPLPIIKPLHLRRHTACPCIALALQEVKLNLSSDFGHGLLLLGSETVHFGTAYISERAMSCEEQQTALLCLTVSCIVPAGKSHLHEV